MVQERKETPRDGRHLIRGAHNLGPVEIRSGRDYEQILRVVRLFHHKNLASRERKYGRIDQRLAYLKKPRFGKRKYSPDAVGSGGKQKKSHSLRLI